MSNIQSSLKGSHYGMCPLCHISTDIGNQVDVLEGKVEEAYKVISDRNEMIDKLQKEMASLKEDLSVARQSLYEVAEQRNSYMARFAKVRKAALDLHKDTNDANWERLIRAFTKEEVASDS